MSKLSHFNEDGKAAMVDVSAKEDTKRTAVAEGLIRMKPETLALIAGGTAKKGDVLGVARVAGIMAAKRTHDLIPLCHPLPISKVSVDFSLDEKASTVRVESSVTVTGKTGVEMEALTAVSVATLTIYDMVKAVDKDMTIDGIQVLKKEGGKSGTYERAPEPLVQQPARLKSTDAGKSLAKPQPVGHPTGFSQAPDQGSPHLLTRAYMERGRIKPLRWAQDAGVQTGALYAYLQGRTASLGAADKQKLAAVFNADAADIFGSE